MISWRCTTRRLRHLMGDHRPERPRWSLHLAMYNQAALVVWFFYVASAFFLYEGSRTFSQVLDAQESLDLLWPVEWLPSVGIALGGKVIAHIGLAAAMAGLLWWRFLATRVFVSAALLLYAAFINSYGAINHGHHEWLWISVCFWFLPNAKTGELATSRVRRMEFLTAFSLAPLLILSFYTLSGIYKCYYAFAALWQGRVGGFAPDAMGITIASRAFQTGSVPLWGEFAVEYPLLSWPFYAGLYFVEIVSIFVFFRPQLHRTWGIVLIAFHFGTLLFMDIIFPKHVLINGLLFVMSPFALGAYSHHQLFEKVPFLGSIYSLVRNPRFDRARPGGRQAAPPVEQSTLNN
jgi:hypothetical protein